MRRAIWKSDAIRFTLLVISLLFILSIFPLRLWQRTITETGGGVRMEVSDPVNDRSDLIQEFIAQYDRLAAVNIRLEEQISGRYLRLTVFDDQNVELYNRYVDVEGETIPGMVRIPVGIPLEVGRQYRLFFLGTHAEMTMGLENIPAGGGASPYYTSFYMHDEQFGDWHLNMTLEYEQPLGRLTSILLILGIAVAAIVAERLVKVIADRRGREADSVITVGTMIRIVLIPVWLVFILCLFVMLLMQKFDWRLADNIFYGAGLIIAGIVGSALIMNLTGAREEDRERDIITNVIEIVQVIALAMGVQSTCEYMNGLYDAVHYAAERREIIWLAVFFILFLIGGKKEEGGEGKKRLRLNIFGILAVLFFILLVIFGNGRQWVITLAVLFAAALICWRFSRRRDRWLKLLTWGLILNFGGNLLYCYLHRYYAGFVSARFSFIFHTVTVTAEYLTLIGAASFALLFAELCRIPRGTGFRGTVRRILPQGVLFGMVSSYVLFTASRTGILAMVLMVLLMLIFAGVRGHRFGNAVRGLIACICALVILFMPTFTLQRLLPPFFARPEYMEIEDAVTELRGAIAMDSTKLISVERFFSVFLDKVAGLPPGDYPYPEDRFNYDSEGNETYPPMGLSEEEMADRVFTEDLLKARAEYEASVESSQTDAQESSGQSAESVPDSGEEVEYEVHGHHLTAEELYDYYIPGVDDEEEEKEYTVEEMSNGRMTLWRSYLPQLNMTGHEEMGVELPNGEIAVHAHNVYLQIAYDNGIPVGILFVLLIGAAAVTAMVYGGSGDDEGRGYRLVPLAITLAFAAAGLTEWNFQLSNMMTLGLVLSWIPLCFKAVGDRSENE
ncbi:MAG: O-antigen ligase family protein [Lachnospiraceae bacterium]|nr:O-antigen ligase family protein [Lachnospiraceae bacterium]